MALIRRDRAPRSKLSCQPMQPLRGSRCASCSFFLASPFFCSFLEGCRVLAPEVWSIAERVCEGERDKRGGERERKRDTAESGLFLQREPPFWEKKKPGKGYGRVCVISCRSPNNFGRQILLRVTADECVSQLKVVFRKSINQSCNVYLYGCGGWGGIKW